LIFDLRFHSFKARFILEWAFFVSLNLAPASAFPLILFPESVKLNSLKFIEHEINSTQSGKKMKKIVKKYSGTSLLAVAILLLAGMFHRSIQIVEVISGTPVNHIELNIPLIRVIFEPVWGYLFFIARGHWVIQEYLTVFYWCTAILLISVAVKFWRLQLQLGRFFPVRGFLLRKLSLFPILILLFITVFLVIIFIPLPTNTVRNTDPEKILIDFHCHTAYSHDGLITPEAQVCWHQRNGFNAFFFSDHNILEPTRDFIRAQEKKSPELVLLPGEEFSGDSHLLLLGVDSTFQTTHFSDETVVREVKRQNGLVFVAHWWSRHQFPIQKYIEWGVDGFEIAKQGTEILYDRQVFADLVQTGRAQNKLMLGTSDHHGYGSFCYAWTRMHVPVWPHLDYSQRRELILNTLHRADPRDFQVLVYADRPEISANWLPLSPFIHAVNYFRSLNLWQVFSWFVWLVGFTWLREQKFFAERFEKLKKYDRVRGGVTGILLGLFLLGLSFYLTLLSRPYLQYNEILPEFSQTFRNIGFIALAYSSCLLIWHAKRKRKNPENFGV
jgi:hypothetical protein